MITLFSTLLRQFWRPVLLILVVALAVWGFGHWRFVAGLKQANQEWSLKWVQRDAADNAATARHEAQERAEEHRRQEVAREVQKDADQKLMQARNDAADALRAGDGLRRQLATLQRQYTDSETRRLSASASSGATEAETIRVLTRLLRESDEMAGNYAAEADRAYIAGQTCERLYQQVTTQPASR